MLEITLWILVAIAALLLLDRFFLWMEAKGWVYYRKVKPKGGMGDILIGSDIFNPGARFLQEARQERAGEEDEDDGDDDGKRKNEDRVT
jgi:hypothetical protein